MSEVENFKNFVNGPPATMEQKLYLLFEVQRAQKQGIKNVAKNYSQHATLKGDAAEIMAQSGNIVSKSINGTNVALTELGNFAVRDVRLHSSAVDKDKVRASLKNMYASVKERDDAIAAEKASIGSRGKGNSLPCYGRRDDGSDCRKPVLALHGYCSTHLNQWDRVTVDQTPQKGKKNSQKKKDVQTKNNKTAPRVTKPKKKIIDDEYSE